ncbi:hypothetical protein [Leifsonia sp. AG29]|uniref:hypothetical protein n=1 Tax=Leifsonia sp. AG29 TaxID=2598860 RepID=UPI00131A8BE5|nr:hypothetical protein [Leifsonia sp. AG29]
MTNSGDQVAVPPAEFSTKTDRQTLDEALGHTDDLVQLLGGEWYAGSGTVLFDRADHTGWSYGPCGAVNTNQYSISVRQVTPIADPLANIEQVRQHWTGLGYIPRQIGPAEASESKITEIVVDLPFGARLGFVASTQMMSIWTESECIKEH